MFRKKSHVFILLLCFAVITPTCYVGYLYYVVTRDAATRIERGTIDRIIASESYVYYDDGHTPIGAFFEKIHRKYILYNEIPKLFIKALIAAEDKNFFSHKGFDLKAILRALVANLRASEVIQGGSTLTQQTAKNIFRRERRSYQAKLKELIQAFLLERRYSKQEILEMYVNQFFVTGYGKGLKIAAQYFFGKDVKDLDLVEAAFIAGSVKGPNRYNPFIKKSRAEKEQARRLAKLRKDYVLLNMHKLNFIGDAEYLKAKNREIPFNQGKITYKLNVVLDYIREQLQSPYFKMILEEQGIENPATSGIGIYTSINKEIQESALRSLRTHLPLLDVNLNGYDGGNLDYPKQELLERSLNKSTDNMPFLGRITHIDPEKENAHLVVSWDGGGSIIDYEGLKSIGEAWIKWKMGNWARFDKKYVPTFLKNFRVGDTIPLQMMPSQESNGEIKLMLSKVPELEGAVVVLHGGMLKAMVGGFFNRFFNRAADAKRQLGSIFKPLVYTAGIQLKWNSLDSLQNTIDVFQYQNTAYVPRPDHPPKSERVSMAWAGIKSENLATVWLLYHLTDHLNMSEFRQITELVGLARKKGESYKQYKERIRDRYGVVVTEEALMEAAFEQAKKEIESDVIFAGSEKMLSSLHRLHFKIEENTENIETSEDRQFLRFSFRRLQEINQRMKGQFYQIVRLLELYGQNYSPHLRESLDQLLRNFYTIQDEGQSARIVYTETPEFLSAASLLPLTPESMLIQHTPLSDSDIWVDDLITSEILETLRENVEKNFDRLLTLKRYELEVLSQVRDFRTLVNLSYVLHLSKNIGISTKLDPVLSFPLGPNSISIIEGATAYQTLMTGQIYPLSSRNGLETAMAPIIEKIVDREGEILWEYRPTPKRILSKRVCGLVTEILRKVMETGTGREARDAVQVFDIPIPTFGKTGTANRFTNSSFIGFLPGSDEETGRLEMEKGYVIASYVGYDDNRPMKGEHLAIYGASGAMPIWIDTANAIANSEDYRNNLQPADLAFNPLPNFLISHGGFVNLPISPVTGLPVSPSAKPASASSLHSIMGEAEDRGDTWRLKRRFEPLEGEKQ